MTIGELAREAGVPVSTLRFYERRGLLAPAARSRAGYRSYLAADVLRVRFLKRAQELGFSLSELAVLLAFSQQRTVRRADVAAVASDKIADLDARIADLGRVRAAILGLLAEPCIDLDAPCPIVAALAERAAIMPAGISRSRSPASRKKPARLSDSGS